MSITDYKRKANLEEEKIFNNPKISRADKKSLTVFLDSYNVSDARRAIFLEKIRRILEETRDLSQDMHKAEAINRIFKPLREQYKPSTYNTYLNITNRYVRWLNDGSKPKGFVDQSYYPKSKEKRNLTPKDMSSWDDGLYLTGGTSSVQLKTIVLQELDGGPRPGEFNKMIVGDFTRFEQFVIAMVNGKTGRRPVIYWRSAPYINQWLDAHPTKDPDDPMWVKEHQRGNKIERWQYTAVAKQVHRLAVKREYTKPSDFYALRHSAVVICKMDGVPDGEGAKKFGHSLKVYQEIYGRLSLHHQVLQFKKAYGIGESTQKIEKPISCIRCSYINPPNTEVCHKCSAMLTLRKVLEMHNKQLMDKEDLEQLKKKVTLIDGWMQKILHKNPTLLNEMADVMKEIYLNENKTQKHDTNTLHTETASY